MIPLATRVAGARIQLQVIYQISVALSTHVHQIGVIIITCDRAVPTIPWPMLPLIVSVALMAQLTGSDTLEPVAGWRIGARAPGNCVAALPNEGGTGIGIVYSRQTDEARIILWNGAWRSVQGDTSYSITARFGPRQETVALAARGHRTSLASGESVGLSFSQNRAFLERLAQAPAIELALGQTPLGAVVLPNAQTAIARLLQCVELQNPPITFSNLASYFSDLDYPHEARARDEQGTVAFRLTIGPDGRVTDCVVMQSSGSALLDETTCRIMRERARFTPARDRDGNPISGTMESRVRWVL